MRTIFFGSPEFAVPALEACYNHSELLAVISQPDKERHRGKKVLPTPVKDFAVKKKIPVFTPHKICLETEAESYSFLKNNKVDVFVVVAFGQILKQEILNLPRFASVNIHASLLPKWRGAAPIQRALENGDCSTGLSLQKMVYELDAGNVLLEQRIPLSENINAIELTETLSRKSAHLLEKFLKETPLEESSFIGKEQNPNEVTYAAKIKKQESYWKASWTAQQFHNKVRAFRAWPKIEVFLKTEEKKALRVKILKTRLSSGPETTESKNCKAGALFINKKHCWLCCPNHQFVEIVELQIPGKGPSSAAQSLNNLIEKTGQTDWQFLDPLYEFES